MQKKILYVDMDGVVADFDKAIKKLCPDVHTGDYESSADKVYELCIANPDIFQQLDPIPNSIMAVLALFPHFDIYFLSTPMYQVPNSYRDKRIWLEKHFGNHAEKRLILTHRKDLNIGHYLVDDRLRNGVENFTGEHIHFGTKDFPDWPIVVQYLYSRK